MSKAELGIKRLCASCGAKFYDLLKNPIVCPKCASVFVPPVPAPPRSRRPVPVGPQAVVKPVLPDVVDDADVEAPAEEEVEEGVGIDDKPDDAGLIILEDQDEADVVGGVLDGGLGKREDI